MTSARSRITVKVPRRDLSIVAGLLVLMSGGSALSLSAEEGGPVLLRITGSDGARFSGDCHVGRMSAGETVHLEGQAPFERHFTETEVKCRIYNAATAQLVVTLRKAPNAKATSTVWGKGECAAVTLE
ncbi:MAG: hypothetical protein ACM3N5_15910 [Candidatus Eiseniibacteriota bacterium]